MGVGKLSKLLRLAESPQGGRSLVYWCPACDGAHAVSLDMPNAQGARWRWNGHPDFPTLWPSVNVNASGPGRCHHFVTDGQIQYCADSQHALAGQTVDMPDFDA